MFNNQTIIFIVLVNYRLIKKKKNEAIWVEAVIHTDSDVYIGERF